MDLYPGPLRGEPLPVELHNTIYAAGGATVDGIADAAGLRAWLAALAPELPVDAGAVDTGRADELRSLREAVREALHAAHERRAMSAEALERLNRASARDPQSRQIAQRGSDLTSRLRHHAATETDALLGVIAASTIELVSGPVAADLRTCRARGCVLMFVRDHPRREWCSPACGNRTRQARHYERTRKRELS